MAGSLACSAETWVPGSSCTCSKWWRSIALSTPRRRWSGCTPDPGEPGARHLAAPAPARRGRGRRASAGRRRRCRGRCAGRRPSTSAAKRPSSGRPSSCSSAGAAATSANQTVWSVRRKRCGSLARATRIGFSAWAQPTPGGRAGSSGLWAPWDAGFPAPPRGSLDTRTGSSYVEGTGLRGQPAAHVRGRATYCGGLPMPSVCVAADVPAPRRRPGESVVAARPAADRTLPAGARQGCPDDAVRHRLVPGPRRARPLVPRRARRWPWSPTRSSTASARATRRRPRGSVPSRGGWSSSCGTTTSTWCGPPRRRSRAASDVRGRGPRTPGGTPGDGQERHTRGGRSCPGPAARAVVTARARRLGGDPGTSCTGPTVIGAHPEVLGSGTER